MQGPSSGRRRTHVVFFILSICALASSAHGQQYNRLDIGLPQGATRVSLTDMNNHLQVVGYADGPDYTGRCFVWTPAIGFRWLEVTGAYGRLLINNHGVVAGLRGRRPFTWVNGTVVDLPEIPRKTMLPHWDLQLRELTDTGILYVYEDVDDGSAIEHFAIYERVLYDLEVITGGAIYGVSNNGVLVGHIVNGVHQFSVWAPQARRVIETLPSTGHSVAIGPAGHIVASHRNAATFRWETTIVAPDGRSATFARYVSPTENPGSLLILAINSSGDFLASLWLGPGAALIARMRDAVNFGLPEMSGVYSFTDGGAILTTDSRIHIPYTPPAPTNVWFVVEGRTVTLWWSESPTAIEYILEAGSAVGATDVYNGAMPPFVRGATGSVPAGRYYVRVRARNEHGSGAASPDVVIDVP